MASPSKRGPERQKKRIRISHTAIYNTSAYRIRNVACHIRPYFDCSFMIGRVWPSVGPLGDALDPLGREGPNRAVSPGGIAVVQ